MVKIKVSLWRSPSLTEYGPEESKVMGAFDNVQLTYDILRVEGSHIGVYDDEKGVWLLHKETITVDSPISVMYRGTKEYRRDTLKIPHELQGTVWSDIHLQPIRLTYVEGKWNEEEG